MEVRQIDKTGIFVHKYGVHLKKFQFYIIELKTILKYGQQEKEIV